MLKIKDDIDLKELKNLMFLEAEQYYYYPVVDGSVEIRVWKSDKTLDISINDYEDYVEDLDKLFELFQAGLVEKA
jgi:hypothetical protein